MKFSELSGEAKRKAAQEYLDGWLETHPGDELTVVECAGLLDTDDECDYGEGGELLAAE